MAEQLYKLMVDKGFIPSNAPMSWPSEFVNQDGTLKTN